MIPKEDIYRVALFSFVPYLVMTIFTIPYFVHQKIQILQRIKNIPATTIFATDLSKVKKNLKIQSLIYNFIVIISSFEALCCLLLTVGNICTSFDYRLDDPVIVRVVNTNTNKSCTFQYQPETFMFIQASESLVFLLPILVNLFLIVLRRAYLSVPYRRWIVGYSGYFLFRLVYIILSAYFIVTQFFYFALELPFLVFDLYVSLKVSKKFYLLLKGMSEEAKWHSTPQEYKQKQRITKTFAIFQSIPLFAFILGLLLVAAKSIQDLTGITNEYCLVQYLFPNDPISFTIPENIIHISDIISHGCSIIIRICNVILGVIAFLLNLPILTSILVKLLRRRKKYIHVNEWITRPLMERYRADVERHIERRPPFIQAFRSHIIY